MWCLSVSINYILSTCRRAGHLTSSTVAPFAVLTALGAGLWLGCQLGRVDDMCGVGRGSLHIGEFMIGSGCEERDQQQHSSFDEEKRERCLRSRARIMWPVLESSALIDGRLREFGARALSFASWRSAFVGRFVGRPLACSEQERCSCRQAKKKYPFIFILNLARLGRLDRCYPHKVCHVARNWTTHGRVGPEGGTEQHTST